MNIIITGASKGVGFQTALKLNEKQGNQIVAISRDADLLSRLKELGKHSRNIHILPFDLSSFSNYNSVLLKNIKLYFEEVDVLINNAGLLINKPFENQSIQDFDQQINLNLKVPYLLSQMLIPYFNKNAHILNISSMGGVQGSAKFAGLSVYSSSKGALAVLTEAMAEEFKERNIKSNCLALGAVQTEMLEKAFPGYEAPLNAVEMGKYVAEFALNGHKLYNGKILPVALTTP